MGISNPVILQEFIHYVLLAYLSMLACFKFGGAERKRF
jgi:hypothetical protein